MSKHIFDHQRESKTGRMRHFLRIARRVQTTWHRSEEKVGSTRVVQFCRIARGRMA